MSASPPPESGRPPPDEFPAWIDRVVDVAGALGMNRVRVRWRLQRRVNEWRATRNRRVQAVVHVRYQHRVCRQCTAVNDRGATVCTRCDTPLAPRALEIAGRLGVHVPVLRSASALLGLAIVAVYARTAVAGHGAYDIPSAVLVAFGGNLPLGEDGGEWWRVATSVFLHAGLWHLGFNLLSLARIGPLIEELYGRGVAVFLFMATGIAAAVGTRVWGLPGVGIGASGAILGLIGAAAAAGHRSGTTIGRQTRNVALRWVGYVFVFGWVMGADNQAHAVGFVAGALFGLAVPPLWITRMRGRRLGVALGALGAAAAIATTVAALVPLSTARAAASDDSPPIWLCIARGNGADELVEQLGGDEAVAAYCAEIRAWCDAGGYTTAAKAYEPAIGARFEAMWRDQCAQLLALPE